MSVQLLNQLISGTDRSRGGLRVRLAPQMGQGLSCGPGPSLLPVGWHTGGPNVIGRRFSRRIRDLACLPAIGLHGLRHTHATLLLEEGVDVKTVSERLGHDSVQTTLELYGRSEERRVGKECRSRWSPYHYKKK